MKNTDGITGLPPKVDGKIDLINAKSGEDLLDFVNKELFPYLKVFKSITQDPKSIKYKIGAISLNS